MGRFALVHAPVLSGKVFAIYVARRDETTWFVAGPNFTNANESQFECRQFGELVELDQSLSELDGLPVGHCASRRDETHPWSFAVVPSGPTFLVTYDTRPDETNPRRDELGGAIVNCWVVADSMDSARHIAEENLAATGWVIVEKMQANRAAAEDYDHDEYFRQAQVDGLVAVFHTYPRDELELN